MTTLPFVCKQDGIWQTNALFVAKAGSDAYSTRDANSDIDYRGVFGGNAACLLGLHSIKTYTEEKPLDIQLMELGHFVRLCLKGSPGQLEMLFYPADVVLLDTPLWQELVAIRRLFLGKHLARTLGGFAQSDIARIKAEKTGKAGAKGKLLIEKYGYNTKHAYNAWRLLKMSETLWLTGELVVRPPEALRQELLAIKTGAYARDDFLTMAFDEDRRLRLVCESADLPSRPDEKQIDKSLQEMQRKVLEIYG